MATKKTPSKTTKKPTAKVKQQKQLAASVGPLLTIIGVLAVLNLLLGFYIMIIQ